VQVEKIGGMNDLDVDLRSILAEWDGRDLNEMIGVSSIGVERLAPWIAERLLLKHPSIVRVEIYDGHDAGVVVQEPKR
jgi:hypothetical protein